MGHAAKAYNYAIIAAGVSVLAASLANWSSPDLLSWTIYLVLAVHASVVKLRGARRMQAVDRIGQLPA
jgi:hypothetical protein